MKRLTQKREDGLYDNSVGICDEEACKLGELEDIEDELNIDLVTLYKALTSGVWIKDEVGQIYHTNVYLHNLMPSFNLTRNEFCFITPNNELLFFERIKQTWALTKQELEEE